MVSSGCRNSRDDLFELDRSKLVGKLMGTRGRMLYRHGNLFELSQFIPCDLSAASPLYLSGPWAKICVTEMIELESCFAA